RLRHPTATTLRAGLRRRRRVRRTRSRARPDRRLLRRPAEVPGPKRPGPAAGAGTVQPPRLPGVDRAHAPSRAHRPARPDRQGERDMKSRLRNLAKRVRDRARLVALPKLVRAIAAPILLAGGALLLFALLWGSALVAAVIGGAIGTVTLVVAVAAWISLSRHLRAVRTGLDRVEVLQRRILAAAELSRLEADE